jgi:hypothetical protein
VADASALLASVAAGQALAIKDFAQVLPSPPRVLAIADRFAGR